MKHHSELDELETLKIELDKAHKAYNDARDRHYENGKAALETVQANIVYTYVVSKAVAYPYYSKSGEGVEAVKVSRVWNAATAAMVERFNTENPQHAIKAQKQSEKYYRTREGILSTYGGGYLILETPCLCSDQQWADLKAGIVPASFIH